MYLRYEEGKPDLLTNKEILDKVLHGCTGGSLKDRLEKFRIEELRSIRKKYEGSDLWNDVVSAYIYMKHKGTYHIFGLGENPEYSIFSIVEKDKDGNKKEFRPKVFNRPEFNVDEWTNKLIEFHKDFILYFDSVLKQIQPKNWSEPLQDDDTIKALLKQKDYC